MTGARAAGPIASAEVPWQDWSAGPRFGGRFRHLTRAAVGDDYHVGVAIEELEPGRQSCPAHYHMLEEEHVFVLEGRLTARIGAQRFGVGPGDYACYPAGRRAGHCLVNEGDAVCRYVVIGERKRDEVVVYTDSRKLLVRSLGSDAVLDLAATRGYWHGEDAPAAGPSFDAVAAATAEPDAPVPPLAADSVPWDSKGRGTRFGGSSRHLTRAAVGERRHLGVLIESPAPGARLCPRHYHLLEEEQALILEGRVTLLLGDERHEMGPGDHVCFPAGREVGHSFLNQGPGPCSYLMIGERRPDDVCVYPDSGKVLVRALGERILDLEATRGYWDGEPAD